MKKILTNFLVVIISTVLTLGVIECGTQIIYNGEIRNYEDLFKAHPAPYKDSEYFNGDFVKESLKVQNREWNLIPNTRVIYPDNFVGKYISVKDHLRVTEFQPDNYLQTIHVFGGSTIFNVEVPDSFTVCSFLQKKINEYFPNQYQVVNYGVPSVNTSQQLERLQMVDLKPFDLVIFYGGVNDGLLFTTGRLDGWIMGESIMNFDSKELNILQKLRIKIFHKLKKKSVFVEKFLNPYSYQIPERLQDSTKLMNMKRDLAKVYKQSIIQADSISRNQGVYFFNFLQPHLFTRKQKTAFEEKISNNRNIIPKVWSLSLVKSYEVLPIVINELNQNEIFSKKLLDIFDNSSQDYYLDFCHLTDKGNMVVANSIFKFILPKMNEISNKDLNEIMNR